MLLRIAVFALLAAGLAGFGAVAWISTRPPAPIEAAAAQPPPEAKLKVLVAARQLRPGSLLKPEDIAAGELPATKVPAGAVTDTPQGRAQLFGAMVRRGLAAGEPLLPADILRPGDHGFLAAVLTPGMRAITIGVDMISGSAGLIWPGDRVDLILTQSM